MTPVFLKPFVHNVVLNTQLNYPIFIAKGPPFQRTLHTLEVKGCLTLNIIMCYVEQVHKRGAKKVITERGARHMIYLCNVI